jgi:orotidine-5'-phosphate decarboxylase
VSMFDRERGLIVAADVSSMAELSGLVEVCAESREVAAIKLGAILALRFGLPAIVAAVRSVSSIDVIYDHQKAGTDIPPMGQPFMEACFDSGVRSVIVFPHSGPRTLEAFVGAAIEAQIEPVVGLLMTHPAYLLSEGGFISDDAPHRIAEIALDLGVSAFVLPGTRPEVVATYSKLLSRTISSGKILMPGIGTQGGELSAACEAAKPHRRFPIVGSAIYKASDPLNALRGFTEALT